jgi:hypothetical protein
MKNTLRQNILDALVYSTVYLFSFQFLSNMFVDGGETGGMFFLISVISTIIISIGVFVTGLLFSVALGKRFIILKSIMFFIICEIVAFMMLSEIAFFGVFQNLQARQIEFNGQDSIATDIYHFRKYRNMSFSIAGLISSVVLTCKYYIFDKEGNNNR